MLFRRLLVGISLIWLGMIFGLSFLGAPLGFMAPGETFGIGLAIGRRVFSIFNKVEWALAVAMVILAVIARQKDGLLIHLGVVWSSLALQTFWLLPILNDRVDVILQGQIPAVSPVHSFYIILEITKAVVLAVYGFGAFRER